MALDVQNDIEIREMTFDDLDEVADIESRNFGSEAWTSVGFLTYLMRNDTLFLISETVNDHRITGYAGLLMVPYEADLINVCVKEEARRRGIASALMDQIKIRSGNVGVTTIHLEVRSKNTGAIALYKKQGFVRTGLRKDYYIGPKDDAITMTYGPMAAQR